MTSSTRIRRATGVAVATAVAVVFSGAASGQAVPGGTLDPLTIPKYVTPLVIPPVMPTSGTANDYDIAVRQFQQQILPGGIWNSVTGRNDSFPATTIWSYGPQAEPEADTAVLVAPSASSAFNYPAYTVEEQSGNTTTVRWHNELRDPATGDYRPHITPVDRSLHWANPEQLPCMEEGKTIDCRPDPVENGELLQQPYLGPVPMVPHVHGAHVQPDSDGYPEAWWLPDADNIPSGYATQGTLVNQYDRETNTTPGVADFYYPNTQPSTTLWYHDHTLGMTRNNVYAGPAGFWLIRDPAATGGSGGETGLVSGILPGPAPVAGQGVLALNVPGDPVRSGIREIPIVIQDRSFDCVDANRVPVACGPNPVGVELFYPANRAFFEGLAPNQLTIDFAGTGNSDIAPIWNPEAFFNVMVVNGVSWPVLEVAPAIYRFRLLNGSNSRFLNLSLFILNRRGNPSQELPFYQIGAEQGLLPQVVEVRTGKASPITAGQSSWQQVNAPFSDQALLMGLAERADVLVDFRGLKSGTVVRMLNTAPDAPFGGFPDIPADPATTGQVMQFVVNSALDGKSTTDPGYPLTFCGKRKKQVPCNPEQATDPWNLFLSLPDSTDPAADGVVRAGARDMALIEEESATVCVTIDAVTGAITQDANSHPDLQNPGTCVDNTTGALALSVPFAPKAAVLGISGSTTPTVTLWSDPIETRPALDATETWELWNHTVDGHPIHLHLVKFKVVNREAFDPLTLALSGRPRAPVATEAGWKDTVIAYPGEVTRLNATFDIAGLYVWHCHIVEHEDNEMMVPFCVDDGPGCDVVP
jgi:spore coat protein A